MYGAARELGVPGPLCMQNDYSIVNRRVEENGLSEASSPAIANAGFMAYNVLAGGMLTGKYGLTPNDGIAPAAVDDGDRTRAKKFSEAPRGRMDTRGWGLTLGRYRTTAMRSAATQYSSHEFGALGGGRRLQSPAFSTLPACAYGSQVAGDPGSTEHPGPAGADVRCC